MTDKNNKYSWYIFRNGEVMLQNLNGKLQPLFSSVPPIETDETTTVHNVLLNSGETVKTFEISKDRKVSSQWSFMPLRESYNHLSLEHYRAAGKASQILFWDRHSRFCPVCGSATENIGDIMKKCPSCGNEMFPYVSTAIIVLIRKEDKVLLVRSNNFKADFYGLVAGFLETGETLEECVYREVMEETGLKIKNLRYFDNQSWPFPSGLMVGFIADYADGELKLQEEELKDAQFFSRESMPNIPSKPSIARQMIEWWINHSEV